MNHDPIVEPSSLRDLASFHVLDVRDPQSFDEGHVANAVRVPIEVWEAAAKAEETSFESVDYWQNAISALGLDPDVPWIVCDDGRMTEAARVWFILQFYGATTFILNGGLRSLREAGSDVPTALPAGSGSAFIAKPASGQVGLIDRERLKAELGTNVQIFDARSAVEFDGQDLRRNARGGHLPGATLLPHADLLDGSFVRSTNELRSLLNQAGFEPGHHIVTHCDGGGRAALAAAAALRAGYDDVRAYYLSFSDWAKDESCPIVR